MRIPRILIALANFCRIAGRIVQCWFLCNDCDYGYCTEDCTRCRLSLYGGSLRVLALATLLLSSLATFADESPQRAAEIARKNAEDRARLSGIVYYVRPFGGRSDQIHGSEPRFDESEIDRLIKRERLDPAKVDRHQVMRLIVERGR